MVQLKRVLERRISRNLKESSVTAEDVRSIFPGGKVIGGGAGQATGPLHWTEVPTKRRFSCVSRHDIDDGSSAAMISSSQARYFHVTLGVSARNESGLLKF